MKLRRQHKIVLGLLAATGVCLGLAGAAWRLHKSRAYQVFGDLITSVGTSDSIVALTFDDGPVPVYTDSVLAILERENVLATFFVVGSSLARYPELGNRIARAGHELGNHSFSHEQMVLMSQDRIRSEVEATDSLIRRAGAAADIPFRPPYGKRLVGLPWYLQRTGRSTVLWTLEPDSWFRNRNDMVTHVAENARPGSIILLHVEISSRVEERAALPLIIQALKRQGYRFVTVSELIAHDERAS
jgi:peptidoglycan/xylan/chitin deacetylase (PgdA/CDA1 family)